MDRALAARRESAAFDSLSPSRPHYSDSSTATYSTPDTARSATSLPTTCLRLVRDYDVDLLKIDFLDQAMAYRDDPGAGDLADIGQAMAAMLAQCADGSAPPAAATWPSSSASPT